MQPRYWCSRRGSKSLRALSAAALAALAGVGTPGDALAARYWKNAAGSGGWSDPTKWSAVSPNGVDNSGPPAGDSADIRINTAADVVVNLNVAGNFSTLFMENTGTGGLTLVQPSNVNMAGQWEALGGPGGRATHTQSAGTNTYQGFLYVGNDAGGTGTYNIAGSGVLTVSATLGAVPGIFVGRSGVGFFNQTGGTVNNTSALTFVGYDAGAVGTYTLAGGTLNSKEVAVGYNGNGTFNHVAGTHASTTSMELGYNAGSSGSYTMSNNAQLTLPELSVGYFGAGNFTMSNTSSANITASTGLRIGAASGANGAVTLNGGTLTTTAASIGGTTAASGGTGTLTINAGGTMTVTGAMKVWNTGLASPSGTRVNLAGGTLNVGTLETNGNPSRFNWTAGTLAVGSSFDIDATGPLGPVLTIGPAQQLSITGNSVFHVGISTNASASVVQNGGTVTRSFGLGIGYVTGQSATYTLTNGTLSGRDLFVGLGGNATFTQTGGTNKGEPNGPGGPAFEISIVSTNGSGLYQLSGTGVLNVNGPADIGIGANGILDISGGTANFSTTTKIWNTSGTALNLSGGTLSVGSLDTNGNPSRFNWTGGTLKVTGPGLIIDPTGPLGNSRSVGPGMALIAASTPGGQPLIVGKTAAESSLFINGGSVTVGSATLAQNLLIGDVAGATGSASLSNNGTLLVTANEYVAVNATGSATTYGGLFNQSSGTHTVNQSLYVGTNPGSSGNFNLSGGLLDVLSEENIGVAGAANFGLVGGTNIIGSANTLQRGLYIGRLAGARGSLLIDNAGTVLTVNGGEHIGVAAGAVNGSGQVTTFGGTLTQPGGTHTVSGDLTIGESSGGTGLAGISGGTLAVDGDAYVGGSSAGAGGIGKLQIGGTAAVTVTGTLKHYDTGLASFPDGTYVQLYGSGSLTVGGLSSGGNASRFRFDGGTLHVAPQGTYNFFVGATDAMNNVTIASGMTLKVGNPALTGANWSQELPGYFSNATLTQTGGTHTIYGGLDMAFNGKTASYAMSGGTLTAGGMSVGAAGLGTMSHSGGSVTVGPSVFGGGGGEAISIGSYAGGTGTYALSGTGTLGVTGAVSVGGKIDGPGGKGTFSIASGSAASISGLLKVWDTSGTSLAMSGGTLTVGSIDTSGNASRFNWTSGNLTITAQNLAVDGSGPIGSNVSLAAGKNLTVNQSQYVGQSSDGTMMNTGGTHTVGGGTFEMFIGQNAGVGGSYSLSGSGVLTVNTEEHIGVNGAGSFTQTGGRHSVTRVEEIGVFSGSFGTYSQTGGTHTVGQTLYLGQLNGATGFYTLSGSASVLTAQNERIGSSGGGTFTQNGGSHTITNTLSLATNAGSGGTYNLNGGTLSVPTLEIGIGGTGQMNRAAGAAVVVTLTHLGPTGRLTLNPNGNAPWKTSTLIIDNGGKLDLQDNKVIATSTPVGSWNGSAYTAISGMIASGRNGSTLPLWDGSGIITSQSNATNGNFHSIAVARASEVRPATASTTATWAGQTITGTDTLIMYTYGGDATLDGKLNIDDYVKIDSGLAGGYTGWTNGDFNYDGKVSIDDYITVIDANIGNQNGFVFPTAGGIGEAMNVVAVPEPAGFALALGMVNLFVRRRRIDRKAP